MIPATARVSICAGLMAGIVAGCSPEAPQQEKRQEVVAAPRPASVTGWEDYKFGMSFDEAVTARSDVEWNAVSFVECRPEMATKGCYLVSDDRETYLPLIDGIAFSPNLTFNARGKLISVALDFDEEGEVTKSQCLDILERTIDRISSTYGPIDYWRERPGVDGEERGWKKVVAKTAAGNAYRYGLQVADDDYVTTPMRTHRPDSVPLDSDRPITEWGSGPYVTVFSHLITLGRGNRSCSVNIDYRSGEERPSR
ncbi:hypothetical protein ACFOMD_06825 [Sphingoaurantiacus capsulatus]|uniref:Lipoprotein n=1 Tax=Sphingoaurantiacus capsulatus TaxID=1771310 RepID=A0ABV7X845_9SPHN